MSKSAIAKPSMEEREPIEAAEAFERRVQEENNARFQELRDQAQATFAAIKGNRALRRPQDWEAMFHLFDEFDSIGSARGLGNDVGEVRRIVNSFLQMVEQDDSDSLVIAATNHVGILDRALFRRFDDVIEYDLPDKVRIAQALRAKLSSFKTEKIEWAKAAASAQGLSFADITRACEDAIKDAIVHDRQRVTHAELMSAIRDRKSAVAHKEHTP